MADTESGAGPNLMPEADFWDLIHRSISGAAGEVENQVASLEVLLSTRSEGDMVGFEATLWEMMKKAHNYNAMAILIAIQGPVSSEKQHIRFRCRLILYGRDVFYDAIGDPNRLTRILDNRGASERLLSVADSAFLRRFGQNTDRRLPSEVASARIDYDGDSSFPLQGMGWGDRSHFSRRYAPLLLRYKKARAAKKRGSPESALPEEGPIPPELMMPEEHFWSLVRASIQSANGDIEEQAAYLEQRIAAKDEKEIVGFELTLRDLLRRSYHYNVMALLKAIDGLVSDDALLYFQCRLILYGRDVFYAAIEDPNKLTERLDGGGGEGEGLLLVADNALQRKVGQASNKMLPRDVGVTYYDYDLGGQMLGKPWTERTFAKRYAALLKLYQ